MTVVIGLLLTCGAQAQSERLDVYSLAPLQSGSLFGVWGSKPLEPGRYVLALGMQVRPPLPSQQTAIRNEKSAGAISTLELLATLGLWQRVDISAGITAYNGGLDGSSSPDAASRTALGDVRLIPRVGLTGGDSGAGFAIAVPVWIPAGNASAYRDQGLRFEPRAVASYFSKAVTLSANAGYLFSQPKQGLRQGWQDAISLGIGAEVPLVDTWSVLTELSSRWQLRHASLEPDARLPLEARAGVRFSIESWVVQLGGGVGLWGGASQPDWRLLASVGFRAPEPAHEKSATAPSDRDGDGIADESDPCPDEPEARRGVSDVDGCPFEASEPADQAAEPPVAVGDNAPSAALPIELTSEGPLPPIGEILYFERNKMTLEPAQLAVLDVVESQLRSAPPDARLVIEGHSDRLGPPPFNASLSQMRASTVRLYLIQRGISWRRLLIKGYGSSRSLEPSSDEAGRARNRRVEFRLIRKHQQ